MAAAPEDPIVTDPGRELAWFRRLDEQDKPWWPVRLEEVPVEAVDESCPAAMMAAIDGDDTLLRVTLLGRKGAAPQLLPLAARGEVLRQPIWMLFNKLGIPNRNDRLRLLKDAGLAAEYEEGLQIVKRILMNAKNNDYFTIRSSSAGGDANGPRRVSVAPLTERRPPGAATAPSVAPEQLPQESAADARGSSPATGARADDDSYAATADTPQVVTASDPGILPDDDWEKVWEKLDWKGWEKVDNVYVKPGVMYYVGNPDVREGIDYFTSLDDVQDHVRRVFHWEGPRRRRDPSSRSTTGGNGKVERKLFATPPNQRTAPQDPGKPLLSTAEKAALDFSSTKRKMKHKARASSIKKTRKAATRPTVSRVMQRLEKSVKPAIAKPSEKPTEKKKIKKYDKKRAATANWWLTESVPSSHDAWRILKKLGYRDDPSRGRFQLPNGVYAAAREAPVFRSLSGLRKFLCAFGIPAYDASLLDDDDAMVLERWVIFANVPVSRRNTAKELASVSLPSNPYQLTTLLTDNGFSVFNGKVWAPNVPYGTGEKGPFFFDFEKDQPRLKAFIRSAWTLDSMALSMEKTKDDDSLSLGSPPLAKCSHKTCDEKHRSLRLWAVASGDIELPEFSTGHAVRSARQIQLLESVLDDTPAEASPDRSDASRQESAETKTPSQPSKQEKKRRRKSAGGSPWWQETPMLSSAEAWSILEQLGFSHSDKGYMLPTSVYEAASSSRRGDELCFQSLAGLRKFLCKFGIPKCDADAIPAPQSTDLDRWVKFANVPVNSRDSLRVLSNISKPKDLKQLSNLLSKNGFTTLDGSFWAPGYKHFMKNSDLVFALTESSEGSDEKSKLKCFVRSSWTLDSSVIYDQEPRDHNPPAKYGNCDDDAHLQLRLWAAAASEDLPDFKLPDQSVEITLMQMIPEDDFTLEPLKDAEWSKASSDMDTSEPPDDSSEPKRKKTRISEGQMKEDQAKVSDAISVAQAPCEKAKLLEPRPWYYYADTDFLMVDWQLLQEAGWNYTSSYSHPAIADQRFENVQEIREYICAYGIPSIEKTKEKLGRVVFEKLVKWAKFALVPIRPNYFKIEIETLEPLADTDALDVLVNFFQFQIQGDMIVPPGTDNGLEKHKIAAWLRSRELWAVGGDVTSHRRGRQKTDAATENLRLRLRLWAAAHKSPLPLHKEAANEYINNDPSVMGAKDNGEAIGDLDSDISDEIVCLNDSDEENKSPEDVSDEDSRSIESIEDGKETERTGKKIGQFSWFNVFQDKSNINAKRQSSFDTKPNITNSKMCPVTDSLGHLCTQANPDDSEESDDESASHGVCDKPATSLNEQHVEPQDENDSLLDPSFDTSMLLTQGGQ